MLKRKCMAQFMVPTIQTWVSPPPWSLSIPTSTWPPSAPSSSYASLGSGIYTYMDISNTNVHSPARRECDRHRVEQHHARLKSSARTGTDNAVRIEQILVSPHNAQASPLPPPSAPGDLPPPSNPHDAPAGPFSPQHLHLLIQQVVPQHLLPPQPQDAVPARLPPTPHAVSASRRLPPSDGVESDDHPISHHNDAQQQAVAAAHHPRSVPKCDELCPGYFFNHILQQKRLHEAETRRKLWLGFKNVKKTFCNLNLLT